MAGKSSKSKTAAPKVKVAPKLTKADSSKSLDAPVTNTTKKIRGLKRRDTDEMIDRAMKSTHFSHISPVTLAQKKVDNLFLADRFRQMIHDLPPKGRISVVQYTELARMYCDTDVSIDALKISQKDEPVDPEVQAALQLLADQWCSTKARKALGSALKSCDELNETSLIGMVRISFDPKMVARSQFNNMVMDIMDYFHRHNVSDKHPLVLQACQPHFARVVAELFEDLRKDDCSVSCFLETHGEFVELVSDANDINTVKQNAEDLSKVKPTLERLVSASVLGAVMFKDKLLDMSVGDFSSQIDGKVEELKKKTAITKDVYEASIKECLEIAKSLSIKSRAQEERTVKLRFLGFDLSMVVADYGNEIRLKHAAAVKELIWGKKKGLPVLPYEAWVRSTPTEVDECIVEESLAKTFVKARVLAAELVKDKSLQTLKQMRDKLNKKRDNLLYLDPHFTLELEWIGSSDSAFEESVMQATLTCLPSESKQSGFSQALGEIAALMNTEMYQKSSPTVQNKVTSVQTMVHNMSRNISPKASAGMENEHYATVLNRLQYFFVSSVSASSAAEPKRGREGVLEYLQHLVGRMSSKDATLRMNDVDKLRPFFWLLDGDRMKLVQDLIKFIAASGKGGIAKAEGSGESVKTAKKAKTSAKAELDTSKANIMNFFK